MIDELSEIPCDSKILISGGCSFSQVPSFYKNWPYFLSKNINYYPFYTAEAAYNNDIIANKTLYYLSKCLSHFDSKNILVGVMWSGVSRNCFYFSKEPEWFSKLPSNEKQLYRSSIVEKNNYYLIQSHIKNNSLVDFYYNNLYDDVGSLINSIKNILLVQNFCKIKNVRYFFTEYSHDTVTNNFLKNHSDVKYLYNLIDLDHFLPIKNMREWCVESGLKYKIENDDHPTSEMSEMFSQTVIIPFLKKKNYI